MTPSPEQPGAPIVVRMDEALAPIVPTYLDNRRRDLPAMRAALARADFEAIALLAHRMKGTGQGYGFSAISGIGARLEKAAQAQDAPSVADCLDELEDYLARVEVVYGAES